MWRPTERISTCGAGRECPIFVATQLWRRSLKWRNWWSRWWKGGGLLATRCGRRYAAGDDEVVFLPAEASDLSRFLVRLCERVMATARIDRRLSVGSVSGAACASARVDKLRIQSSPKRTPCKLTDGRPLHSSTVGDNWFTDNPTCYQGNDAGISSQIQNRQDVVSDVTGSFYVSGGGMRRQR